MTFILYYDCAISSYRHCSYVLSQVAHERKVCSGDRIGEGWRTARVQGGIEKFGLISFFFFFSLLRNAGL